MNSTKAGFDLRQELQTKQLEELATEMEALDLSALSITVKQPTSIHGGTQPSILGILGLFGLSLYCSASLMIQWQSKQHWSHFLNTQ